MALGRLERPVRDAEQPVREGRPIRVGQVALDRMEWCGVAPGRRWPAVEQPDEGREQQNLDVPAQEALEERRPEEDERHPWPRDREPPTRPRGDGHLGGGPGEDDRDPGQHQQGSHERNDERRIQERQVVADRGGEALRQVRRHSVKPALRRPEWDLDVDSQRIAGQKVSDGDRDADPEQDPQG